MSREILILFYLWKENRIIPLHTAYLKMVIFAIRCLILREKARDLRARKTLLKIGKTLI